MSQAAMARYNELKEVRRKAKEEQGALVRLVFDAECQALFAKFPEMHSFSWTQYTPYFNDGEPCEFSANVDYPCVNGVDLYEVPQESRAEDEPMYAEVSQLLNQFDQDDLEQLFGDHVEVKVTRAGANAEAYQHD